MEVHEVIIVGGGPTGLSAARALYERGMRDVVVLEREATAGGIPRHCGHAGFGWKSHRRFWTGPRFAARLRDDAAQVDVRTGTTVLAIHPGGELTVGSSNGCARLRGKCVLIATGARETPRAARLVGGTRPDGVMTTGALQQHVYIHRHAPFARPVIVGSEWVSLSTILTCKSVGVRPLALIDDSQHQAAPKWALHFVQIGYRVPVWGQTRIVAVHGHDRVEAAEVEQGGNRHWIECDGVVFTGRFRPEDTLFAGQPFLRARLHQGQAIDRFRLMDPHYVVAGNASGPLKSSGDCWKEGRCIAGLVADIASAA